MEWSHGQRLHLQSTSRTKPKKSLHSPELHDVACMRMRSYVALANSLALELQQNRVAAYRSCDPHAAAQCRMCSVIHLRRTFFEHVVLLVKALLPVETCLGTTLWHVIDRVGAPHTPVPAAAASFGVGRDR
eukprot:52510-Eustigmatos_ZCMA.PRE.1